MLRLLWTLLQLGLILMVIAYIGQFNAPVQIVWAGFVVEASLLTLAIGLTLFFGIFLFVMTVILRIRRIPKKWQEFRKQRRRETGYRALTRGMVAVAAGEKIAAQKAARQAENLLQDPPLTMLLSAQSAQLEGDELAAKKYFTRMLDHPEMAFLGWRGLIMQALREDDRVEAQSLIERAEQRFPKQPWLVSQALEFQQREGNMTKALTLVHRAQKTGLLSATEARVKEFDLLLLQAQENFDRAIYSDAASAAQKAWKLVQKHYSQIELQQNSSIGRLHLLRSDIAAAQQNKKLSESALRLAWQYGAEGVLDKLEQMFHELAPIQYWKSCNKFFQDQKLDSNAAIWLARIALDAGLIGEAENVLNKDPAPEHLGHYQLRILIAEQQENPAGMQEWQQKLQNLSV